MKRRRRSAAVEAEVARLTARVDTLERFAADAVAALASQQPALEGLDARITNLERADQIRATMAYLRDAPIDDKALVSVVLVTRNRSGYLPRAVASVLAQTYPTWELLAVDDGSDDDTPDVLAGFDDERVRRFRTPHRGTPAARNIALGEAAGDYVAYIDDDNTMHPDWLRAVVWAFTTWPEADLLYGATVVESPVHDDPSSDGMPWLRFVPFDRTRLEQGNPTDIGAVAHRAGLAEAAFDEDLASVEDWDLLLRVARSHELLAVPVIAGTYSTTAPYRLSSSADRDGAVERLRRKHTTLTRTLEGTADQ